MLKEAGAATFEWLFLDGNFFFFFRNFLKFARKMSNFKEKIRLQLFNNRRLCVCNAQLRVVNWRLLEIISGSWLAIRNSFPWSWLVGDEWRHRWRRGREGKGRWFSVTIWPSGCRHVSPLSLSVKTVFVAMIFVWNELIFLCLCRERHGSKWWSCSGRFIKVSGICGFVFVCVVARKDICVAWYGIVFWGALFWFWGELCGSSTNLPHIVVF